jgi:hypothetical protein
MLDSERVVVPFCWMISTALERSLLYWTALEESVSMLPTVNTERMLGFDAKLCVR